MDATICDPKRQDLLRSIMQVQFETVELGLFLDTHPADAAALAAYRMYTDRLLRLRADYEAAYGPLLNFGWGMPSASWQWNDDPWPWEINWRRGV